MNQSSKFSVRDICYAGLFAAVIAVMAKVCMVMGTPRGMGMEIWAITAMTAAKRPA